ncbi:Protein of unknown function [Thermomonospora echinospora]|uniref:DUF998 domain-containing protein n=1 Tax=Thermomonospora echinospora TaxID=1992 RepID=A0A1H6CK46_9ACTN|nr:DUF998 domain-containing protein [Thermomonospora echinospora]SEG73117.1 Protein of unknown function [Thermomonospora echinospora]
MIEQRTRIAHPATCDRETSVTRSLLGYGVIAGPVYVAVSLAQALTRDGFDLTRHSWSLLANGDLGWIHIANFMVTAAATLACAVGLRRALGPGRGGTWVPRLVAGYGVSLIAAGVFRADPAMGFPAGTPAGPGAVSWQGMLHLAAGAVGFTCLIAACFVIARRFAAGGRRGWAGYSRLTGVLFLLSFAAISTGGGASWATVTFVAGVVLAWAWLSALSLHLYRHA